MKRRCKATLQSIPPHVLFVLTWGTASKRMCVFPKHPKTTRRRFCRGCSRWLLPPNWTTAKGNEDNRCDACMREAWRRYNEAARSHAPETTTMPKGWGF